MNKQTMKNDRYILGFVVTLAISVFLFSSCKDMLDADMKDTVPADKNFMDESDARSMDLGINSLHKELLADQYVLLGELRGDLVDVTSNADEYMRQISQHNVDSTKDNPYIKPENFYQLILNCNDAIKNMKKMNISGRLDDATYLSYYADVVSFRCWAYYLLAVHFGNVPYVTEPVESIKDMQNSKYPVISLDAVVDSCVNIMQTLPEMQYNESAPPWPMIDNLFYLGKTFVHRTMFLGDLYLWQGRYDMAAVQYMRIMSWYSSSSDLESQTRYKCNSSYWSFTTTNKWPDMFTAKTTSKGYLKEWLWICYNAENHGETNSLVDYFSSSYGKYLLRPTQLAMDNWKGQVLQNGSYGDMRGENASWMMDNGNPVVRKYLTNVKGFFNRDADLFIYRAGTLTLRYAESVNRLGKYKLALAMLGPVGITSNPAAVDVAGSPYDFNAAPLTGGAKIFAATNGPRGRAYLMAPVIPDLSGTSMTLQDTVKAVEDIIMKEYALEVAFEGERWMDLLRVALRREKDAPGTGADFLASGISQKFAATDPGLAGQVKNRLENKKNWFLPLRRTK